MTNMIDVMVDDGVFMPVSQENIEKAVKISCFEAGNIKNPSLCIRFANNDVVQGLNKAWREKDKVTDVLSFPMQEAGEIDAKQSLGDIILAVPFVCDEAQRLKVSEQSHAMHLIAHATLHLLGYDHIEDDEAEVMQKLENIVMLKLGLHQPYITFSDEVKT